MKVLEFIKKEAQGWNRLEQILFPAGIILIILISIYLQDSKIALLSAICGICYTILAGKGKISCYLFGLCGTLCYSYISFKNGLYGNLLLYLCCYLPMQIWGIFQWKNNLKKESQEIVKTRITTKQRVIYFTAMITASIIAYFLLKQYGDTNPLLDGISTVFSVFGMLFTVKRCIEQWYIWILVNGISTVMWIDAYINGSNCFATILMWGVYFVLAIYFLKQWGLEIRGE